MERFSWLDTLSSVSTMNVPTNYICWHTEEIQRQCVSGGSVSCIQETDLIFISTQEMSLLGSLMDVEEFVDSIHTLSAISDEQIFVNK